MKAICRTICPFLQITHTVNFAMKIFWYHIMIQWLYMSSADGLYWESLVLVFNRIQMTWKQGLVSGQFKLSMHLEKFTYVSTVCVSFCLWTGYGFIFVSKWCAVIRYLDHKKQSWGVGLFKLTSFWNYQDKCRWATASEDHWVLLISAKNRKLRLSLHELTKIEQQGNEKHCLYELALIPCNNEV